MRIGLSFERIIVPGFVCSLRWDTPSCERAQSFNHAKLFGIDPVRAVCSALYA